MGLTDLVALTDISLSFHCFFEFTLKNTLVDKNSGRRFIMNNLILDLETTCLPDLFKLESTKDASRKPCE